MEFMIWLIIFLTGMAAGSIAQWLYSETHRPNRAGRLLISRDEDGTYLTASIENTKVLQAGKVVEFDVWEVTQNEQLL